MTAISQCSVPSFEKDPNLGRILSTVAIVLCLGLVSGLTLLVVRRARKRARERLPARVVAERGVAHELQVIRETDPDFSLVLFEDFLYALYAEAHTARGQGQLARLAPYLELPAQQELGRFSGTPVTTVVVGAMTYDRFLTDNPELHRVEVWLEANYTEGGKGYYAKELWTLARQRSARSRPPARIRVFRCPSCDAPTDQIAGRVCGYCGEAVCGGRYEWGVEKICILYRHERGPMLTGTTEEEGTELPTVMDPELAANRAALTARDPQVLEGLPERVGLIFESMQTAWSSLEWERARPFLSDRLHEVQSYWIGAYREEGLRNITEETRIERLMMVRVTSDRWYDSVTYRVFATGLDYTIRQSDGKIVGGSKTKTRRYSEYWTLIRSASRSGPARAELVCPQCGAPLSINMAGLCSHCQAKANSGEFDWVLSRIEQDDSYQG